MTTQQYENELKALRRKLEDDQKTLLKTGAGSEAEFIYGCCVAVRAKALFTFVKESHPELRG